jgi:ADP-heptose:LPS heptosyltransferase/GT2 family glycosyltransferase
LVGNPAPEGAIQRLIARVNLARISRADGFFWTFSVPQSPKNVLYVRADSFGDMVLFAPALSQLIKAWPGARHTLLVRPGYDSLKPLFPAETDWKTAAVNPFKDSPAAARTALKTLLTELEANPPDLIVAATLSRTWLEAAIAARFPQARRVALGHGAVNPLFAMALALELGVKSSAVFPEIVETDPLALDWENNFRLADHLLGRKLGRTEPVLNVPAGQSAAAAKILSAQKLAPGGWVACYPAGVANVTMKAWPAARFAETVAWLHREHGLKVMLLGHRSEAAVVEEVAALTAKAGAPRPASWLSRDGEIPLMAALLATAKFYLGNDTGPMHVSAAVGVPTIGIFGGGFWPRFKPVGRQVVSVVQPLPCFGCNWDCHFGDAPCVKTLAVAEVQAAVTRLLGAKAAPLAAVIEARNLPADAHALIAAVTPRYRQLQTDRLDRQHKIEELTHLGREKDVENADLKRAAEERKAEMEAIKAELEAECAQKDTEIAELKAETDTKDTEIASLKGETDTKDTEIASLKGEANTKDAEIAQLKAEADTKDAEIARLKTVCDEREALIFKLTDIVKDFQRQVAELNTTVEAETREAAEARARFEKIQTQFAALPPEAAQYGQWLHDKNVHIANLERAAEAGARQVRELQSSIDNINRGYGELEQIKRYGRWLHEKEIVLQQLKRACDEREALIRQLVAENAGLGRAGKAWLATRQLVRLKFWQPARNWVFKKVVEDYWMQLGVLRHYDPRPIAWDPRLPRKGRLPDAQLPAVVIVTPSYNQDKFLESTMLSVLNQNYPRLRYRVQDGASTDRSPEIIRNHAARLASWESAPDRGQSAAIRRGFDQLPGEPGDVLAWLNSDDFIAPRALRFVAEYFARHPQVDAVYGHRIIIDGHDREIGRWIMPRHDRATLEWIDYVPQETLFFRRRAWDAVGGLDPSFQFALDWDLLARFQQAGARIVRLPYFLGCFRVHTEQKTSAHIHTTGHEEMTRIRTRIHGPQPDAARIEHYARKARFAAALTARLHGLGIRF